MDRLSKNMDRVPEPTLRRLPWYLSSAKLLRNMGVTHVSSTQISRQTGIDSSQIAKDLSFVNISGRTRVGYDTLKLIAVLEDFLGFTKAHRAYLFGVGNLGGALLSDSGLRQFGLEIVGAFDVKASIVGRVVNGIHVYHADELESRIAAEGINIGVLTVPISIAQQMTDRMISAGIKALWNFTPIRIRVPAGIVVQNTSIYAHLAVMFNRLEG